MFRQELQILQELDRCVCAGVPVKYCDFEVRTCVRVNCCCAKLEFKCHNYLAVAYSRYASYEGMQPVIEVFDRCDCRCVCQLVL